MSLRHKLPARRHVFLLQAGQGNTAIWVILARIPRTHSTGSGCVVISIWWTAKWTPRLGYLCSGSATRLSSEPSDHILQQTHSSKVSRMAGVLRMGYQHSVTIFR